MLCRYCGCKLEDEWKICPKCNPETEEEADTWTESDEDTRTEPPEPPKTPGIEAYYMEHGIQPPKYMPAVQKAVPQMQKTPHIKQVQYTPRYNAAHNVHESQLNKPKIITAVAIGAAAVFIGILLLLVTCVGDRTGNFVSDWGGADKDPGLSLIDSYIRAVESEDKEKLVNLYHIEMADYYWDSYGLVINAYDRYYKEHRGEKVIRYELIGSGDIYSVGGGEFAEDAEELFGLNVSDAMSYNMRIDFEDYTDYLNITIIKVGQTWYVYSAE